MSLDDIGLLLVSAGDLQRNRFENCLIPKGKSPTLLPSRGVTLTG
jgi:hypothetical protein